MKHFALFRIVCTVLLTTFSLTLAFAEGSKDFIDFPGERLFFHAQVPQQLKVYAVEGEYLNFGTSHVGITGGFIRIFRPDGSLHSTYDNSGATEGQAIIYDYIQERNGPTGGGTLNGQGYNPGVIQVGSGEAGVWSLTFEFPSYNIQTFINLQNNEPWNRAEHQPLIQRVITAWDITVSKGAAGNNGGKFVEGRVYTNEYGAICNQVSASTSPVFHVLTKDGLEYEVIFGDVHPWGFQLNSSSKGVFDGRLNPIYKSTFVDDIIRTDNLNGLDPNGLYMWEPQAEDHGEFINNKIFFNTPDINLPLNAMVTDIVRNNTHETWLYRDPDGTPVDFEFLSFSPVQNGAVFLPEGVMDVDLGTYILFDLNRQVSAAVLLDLNYDGDYDDDVDRALYRTIGPGIDTIFWDARDGMGDKITTSDEPIHFDFQFFPGQGEIHIALADIEENPGGIRFKRLNGLNAPSEGVIYNHTAVGGGYSGGILPYQLEATSIPYTYSDYWGNRKSLDYYSFEALPFADYGVDLTVVQIGYDLEDSDFDGIKDGVDLDDDNDGIPDAYEYCGNGGSDCLPFGITPWGDNDEDGVKNYLDDDDPSFSLPCSQIEPGVCQETRSIFDQDGDGRPNHLDNDADNDGIFDLLEAKHGQLDLDQDGMIDGDANDFGSNGLFNALSTDPSSPDADIVYTIRDSDGDGYPDFLDLDSDNDGIPETIENGLHLYDLDQDGRLDNGNSLVLLEEYFRGIAPAIHHLLTDVIPEMQPDQDGDGVYNHLDLDSDNDGIHDVREANYTDNDNDGVYGIGIPVVNSDGIPSIESGLLLSPTGADSPFSLSIYDTDQDGVPDFLDLDSDNDGLNDVREANYSDDDNDGFLGIGKGTVNETGITIADAILVPFMLTSFPSDIDGDEKADYVDLDSDNDGINDVVENGRSDTDNNGFVGTEQSIANKMGQLTTGGTVEATSMLLDQDGDSVFDYNDRDSDNDGIFDVSEAALSDEDNDGILGQGLATVDNFGRIINATESVTSNPGDQDGDGIYNFRDLDADNDGILDTYEAGFVDPDVDGIIGQGNITVDAFGIAMADGYSSLTGTSDPINSDGVLMPDYLSLDSDSDNIPDVIEAQLYDPDFDGLLGEGLIQVDANGIGSDPGATPPIEVSTNAIDSDDDGLEDFRDPDSDNDGLLDIDECPTLGCRDLDQDGFEDFRDPDRDGDGIEDLYECSTGVNCRDLDGDGAPDIDDLDSDNDQLPDAVECPDGVPCPDNDGSLVEDVYEFNCHEAISPSLMNVTESATFCKGSQIVLSAMNDGVAEGNISYTWTLPDGSDVENTVNAQDPLDYEIFSATENAAGVYTLVSQAANGCTSTQVQVEVEIIDIPLPATLVSTEKELCAGGVIEIDAMTTASNGLSYHWYFDDGSGEVLYATTTSPTLVIPDAQVENQGSYSMIITGANCQSDPSNIEFITVKPIITEAFATNNSAAESPACAGSSISLYADAVIGAEYLWTGPNGFTSTEQNPNISNVTEQMSGDYQYTIVIPGCSQAISSATTVFIQQIGARPIIEGTNTACIGGSLSLTVPNNYDPPQGSVILYEWYSASNGNLLSTTSDPLYYIDQVEVGEEDSYYVEVQIGECKTDASTIFDVTIQNTPTESAFIAEELRFVCDETVITAEAATPVDATGMWSSPDGVTIVTPENETTIVSDFGDQSFRLIWSLSNGSCTDFSRDTLFVEQPTAISAMDDVYTVDLNGILEDVNVADNDDFPSNATYDITITIPPANGVATIDADGTLTYEPAHGFLGDDELSYQLCVIGCDETCVSGIVVIDIKATNCIIPNIMTPNGDGMNDTFIIPCADQHPGNELMIINRWGDQVFSASNYQNDWNGEYRGGELPPGTYYYVYKADSSTPEGQSGFITIVR